MSDQLPLCELCGHPMPEGESMFKFHGYSGPCPKPSEVAKHAIETFSTIYNAGKPAPVQPQMTKTEVPDVMRFLDERLVDSSACRNIRVMTRADVRDLADDYQKVIDELQSELAAARAEIALFKSALSAKALDAAIPLVEREVERVKPWQEHLDLIAYAIQLHLLRSMIPQSDAGACRCVCTVGDMFLTCGKPFSGTMNGHDCDNLMIDGTRCSHSRDCHQPEKAK